MLLLPAAVNTHLQKRAELIVEAATPNALATLPRPFRIATLEHKARNVAVEERPVVRTAPRERKEVERRALDRVAENFALHVAHRCVESDRLYAWSVGGKREREREREKEKVCGVGEWKDTCVYVDA